MGNETDIREIFYGTNGKFYPLKVYEGDITGEPVTRTFLEPHKAQVSIDLKGKAINFDFYSQLNNDMLKSGFVSPVRWEKTAVMRFSAYGEEHEVPCMHWADFNDMGKIVNSGINLYDPTEKTIFTLKSVRNVSLEYK